MSEQASTDAAAAPEQVAGETITTEAPVEGTPEATAEGATEAKPAEGEGPDFTPKFAALARDEKRTREGREALKRDREAHTADMAEVQAFKELQAAAKDNPALLLDAMGVKGEDLIKSALTVGEEPTADTKVAALEAKLAAMEVSNAETAEAAKKATTQAEVKKYQADVVNYVKGKDKEYEAINLFGAQQDVADLIVAAWQRDGKQLQVDEAAKLIEDHLVEQAQLATKLSKLKPAEEAASLPSIPGTGPSTQTPMTLTTATGTGLSPTNGASQNTLSRQESLRASAKIIEQAFAKRAAQ